MNKNLLALLGLAPILSPLNAMANDRPDPRPNIIFFLVDDMGWQDTSLPFWTQKTMYNERYETPNMERLARQGMMFTLQPDDRSQRRPSPGDQLDLAEGQDH